MLTSPNRAGKIEHMAVVKDKTSSVIRTKGTAKASEGRGHAPQTSTQHPAPLLRPGSCLWPRVPQAEGYAVQKLFSPLSTEKGKPHSGSACSSVRE